MSRGHGQLQRYILDTIDREVRRNGEEGGLVPLPVLAAFYVHEHDVEDTPSLRSSLRRAGRRLRDERAISVWYLRLPTLMDSHENLLMWRPTWCVYPPTRKPTEAQWEGAVLMMRLFVF